MVRREVVDGVVEAVVEVVLSGHPLREDLVALLSVAR
jgi:hypothetical protein